MLQNSKLVSKVPVKSEKNIDYLLDATRNVGTIQLKFTNMYLVLGEYILATPKENAT